MKKPPSADRRQQFYWLALAALALLAPHIVPAATVGALDSAGQRPLDHSWISAPATDFPGSAFFYAEGAFDPAAEVEGDAGTNVLALSSGPAAIALPFRAQSALDQYRATNCLTSAIYYEAGNEPVEGQRAVAQVVLNRVRHPGWPGSVCGVVYQGSERLDTRCQFTFSCDGAMTRVPNTASWARARQIAARALAGAVYTPVGLATHYHTLAVHPEWANSLNPVAVIGAHIFYRLPGTDGSPRAFSTRYAGYESQAGPSPRAKGPYVALTSPAAPIMTLPGSEVVAPSISDRSGTPDNLPQSTIRPEFSSTGRPLI